jgi:LuxR family maltose regulon positive regulatory protein
MAVSTGAGHAAARGRVAWFAPKMTPPTVRTGTVDRKRLVDRLRAADATQVVIAAPAGYGKSTLAALWSDRDDRAFGWITVDEADNDPVVFLTYLVLALDSISPLERALVDEVTTTSTPWSQTLPRVLDAVAAVPEPFVLVVDDVHRLTGPSATQVLPALAGRIPAGSALASITRGATYPSASL